MRSVRIETFEGVEQVTAYTVNEYKKLNQPVSIFLTKRKNRQTFYYCERIAAFDIETTSIDGIKDDKGNYISPPYGFMYIWQFCFNHTVIYGRYWDEFTQLLDYLSECLDLSDERFLVIYVHNLGFEFQFMQNFLPGELNVFAVKKRTPLTVRCRGFEFRCSWKLTNMTLEKACKNEYGMRYKKLSGELDYSILRTAKTHLEDNEFAYSIVDVLCLEDLIYRKFANEHDDVTTIPLTSTGYIRRRARKKYDMHFKTNRREYMKNYMTSDVYEMLLEAGRGGDTHANRYMSGRIIHNCDSYDFVSSYIYCLMCMKYPVTKFCYYGNIDNAGELDRLLSENACLFRLTLEKVDVKEHVPSPYIPLAKCRNLSGYTLDNGRILHADSLEITVTDIDYKIIMEQYESEHVYIKDMYIAKYGECPQFIKELLMELFRDKCELKEAIEEAENRGEDTADLKYRYAKCKNLLNGVFGMMYTKPLRDNITVENGEWKETAASMDDLPKRIGSYNSFLVYAHGVWTTANARSNLWELSKAFGYGHIYNDTDSVKGVLIDGDEKIKEFNRMVKLMNIEHNSYCKLDSGKLFYLGVAECETEREKYKEFKTLGAKKYCYTDSEGLHSTISGVSKKEGARELGTIDNFEPGFIFKESAGLNSWYNDTTEIYEITVDGCTFKTSSNIGLLPSTYELSMKLDYMSLIGYNK